MASKRKVFHQEKNGTGLAMAVALAIGFTVLLFGFLPFAHRVNKGKSTTVVLKMDTVELPQTKEEEDTPPPPPPQEKEEEVVTPQLAETAQPLNLNVDLDIAVGSGGALAGFGQFGAGGEEGEAKIENTFDVADLEKRPEVVVSVPPQYPAELRKAKVEGTVTVVFVLDESGRVEDPRVENSSRPEFELPALEAVRRWKFKPGMREGNPVRTYMKLPFRFRVSA